MYDSFENWVWNSRYLLKEYNLKFKLLFQHPCLSVCVSVHCLNFSMMLEAKPRCTSTEWSKADVQIPKKSKNHTTTCAKAVVCARTPQKYSLSKSFLMSFNDETPIDIINSVRTCIFKSDLSRTIWSSGVLCLEPIEELFWSDLKPMKAA